WLRHAGTSDPRISGGNETARHRGAELLRHADRIAQRAGTGRALLRGCVSGPDRFPHRRRDAHLPVNAQQAQGSGEPVTEPYRILVVDDEPEIRKGIKMKVDWAAIGAVVAAE